jgi:hypothetical protein
MIIFGHRFIQSSSFYHVTDIDSISKTPPASIIYIPFSENNLDIISHAQINQISTAIYCDNITEIIYASNLDASFIVVKKELAIEAQKLANEYLFDAKILLLIENEDEIEEFAKKSIDGVIFSNAIIKVSS